MQNTFEGYTPQIQREINAISEREQIKEFIDATYEPKEKRVFNTLLICVCLTVITIPTVLIYL